MFMGFVLSSHRVRSSVVRHQLSAGQGSEHTHFTGFSPIRKQMSMSSFGFCLRRVNCDMGIHGSRHIIQFSRRLVIYT